MVSMQRYAPRLLVAAAVALGILVGTASAASHPRTVASWPFVAPYGTFAESMAAGPDGNLYVSLSIWGEDTNLGQIVQVTPAGVKSPFGDTLDIGYGLLTGVAFYQGDLYVGVAFSDSPGVYRVPASGPPEQVLRLPEESFPNGIAFEGGYLYVTDSFGAVWKSDPAVFSAPTEPWLADDLLLPGAGPRDHGIGANGIAFRGGWMYIGVADGSRIVRAQLQSDGSAGALQVLLERATLHGADGIAFDGAGNLWITTNGPNHGQVVMLGTNGKLDIVATQTGLDYPTMPVFGPTGTLFVSNGSFEYGTPSVVSLP